MLTQKKIYIIDNDLSTARIISSLFLKTYEIKSDSSARKALQFLKRNRPDLIFLASTLPNVDVRDFYNRLKHHVLTASVPIILIADNSDIKLKFSSIEVNTILKKPLKKNEIKIQVEKIFKDQNNVHNSFSRQNHLENKMISLLKFIKDQPHHTINPLPDPARLLGYVYPGLDVLLENENNFVDLAYLIKLQEKKELSKNIYNDSSELIYLENLVEKKALSKKVYDIVHLCLYCNHHDINVREVCPNCKSIEIEKVEMIHHFLCAFIGPEKEFKYGLDYVCPKCNKILRQLNMDYDKPARSCKCQQCNSIFRDVAQNFLCINCGKMFDAQEALVHPIYSYTLTEHGDVAIENGQIEDASFELVFWDLQLELYTLPFVHQQIKLEIKRARRYEKSFCLMQIQLNNMEALRHVHGNVILLNIMRELGRIIIDNIRNTDLAARHSETELLFLLPETKMEDARLIADRIRHAAGKIKFNVCLNINLAEYPRSGTTHEQLLSAISDGHLTTHESDENQTVCSVP